MSGDVVKSLGHDILWCANIELAPDLLADRIRFLDELWLPCPLASLTEEQVCLINRYRESVVETESRYDFARQARANLSNIVRGLNGQMIVEIGCGKFPIDVRGLEYIGIDIDQEAIDYVRAMGRTACKPQNIEEYCVNKSDIVVSSYAMHFRVDDVFLEDIGKCSTEDAVFCFNIINDDTNCILTLLHRIAYRWPILQVVKTESMARREFYFIAGKYAGANRFNKASEIIRL